jgi:hypothetical protein
MTTILGGHTASRLEVANDADILGTEADFLFLGDVLTLSPTTNGELENRDLFTADTFHHSVRLRETDPRRDKVGIVRAAEMQSIFNRHIEIIKLFGTADASVQDVLKPTRGNNLTRDEPLQHCDKIGVVEVVIAEACQQIIEDMRCRKLSANQLAYILQSIVDIASFLVIVSRRDSTRRDIAIPSPETRDGTELGPTAERLARPDSGEIRRNMIEIKPGVSIRLRPLRFGNMRIGLPRPGTLARPGKLSLPRKAAPTLLRPDDEQTGHAPGP